MGNPVHFLGWNITGGGLRVCNGDEYIVYNFTEATSSSSIMSIQRNASAFFELLNDSGVKVASVAAAIGSTTPTFDIQGAVDRTAGLLRIYDSTNGKVALTVYRATNSASFANQFVLGNTDNNHADSIGARFVHNVGSDTPLGKVASFGYQGASAFIETLSATADGKVHLAKTTGADLVWDSNGGGNVGESSGNKPANVYANNTVNAAGTVLKVNALDLGPIAATNKTITALQTGTNDPAVQYKVGIGWQFTNDGTTWIPLTTPTWDSIYAVDKTLLIDSTVLSFEQTSTSGVGFYISRALTSAQTDNPIVKFSNTAAADADDQNVLHIDISASNASYALGAGVFISETSTTAKGVVIKTAPSATATIPQYSIYDSAGTERFSAYSSGRVYVSNNNGSVSGISIDQQANSSSHGLSTSGSINASTSSTVASKNGLNIQLTRTGVLTSGNTYVGGMFTVVGANDITPMANTGYIGLSVLFTPTGAVAESYGLMVDPDYRVGALFSSTRTSMSSWTSVDKSAIVINSTDYSTTDSYGIVCTPTGTRPSDILAAGKAALVVSSDWDYGLYSLAPVYLNQTLTTGASMLTVIRSAANAGNNSVVYFSGGTDAGSTLELGGSTSNYCLSTLGKVLIDNDDSTLTNGKSALLARFASNSVGVTTYLSGARVEATGDAGDGVGSWISAFDAVTSINSSIGNVTGLRCTGTGRYGVAIGGGFLWGISSGSKIYVELDADADGVHGIESQYISSVQLTSGQERCGMYSSISDDSTDLAGSRTLAFKAVGSDNGGASARAGFYADSNWDYGLYSESTSYVKTTGNTNGSAVLLNTFVSTALGAATSVSGVEVRITAHASDNATAVYKLFNAKGDGGTGAATFYGLYADAKCDFGVYSQASLAVVHTKWQNSNETSLLTLSEASSHIISDGKVRRHLYIDHTQYASDTFAAYRGIDIERSAILAGTSFRGVNIGIEMEYGIYCAAEKSLFSRGNNDTWISSANAVLKAENLNTATSTAHALHAKLVKSTDGMYAVALENTAETGNLAETAHHLGFVSVLTNQRVLPAADWCPRDLGGVPDYAFIAATTDQYWEAQVAAQTNDICFPLYLPHMCSIIEVSIGHRGNNATASNLVLYSKTHTTSTTATTVHWTQAATTVGSTELFTWSGSVTLDNSLRQYWLKYTTVGTGTALARIFSLQITYTLQDLGAAPGF